MPQSLKLFFDWPTNGSVFSETSAFSINSGERWGIGKFCRGKRLSKRKKVVYLEQKLTVCRMLNSSFRYKRLAGGHIRFWRRYSAGSGKRFGWYFFAQWWQKRHGQLLYYGTLDHISNFFILQPKKSCSYTFFKR